MKVLVAEDDAVVLHLVQRLLEKDFEVELARNGEQAWRALARDDGPRLAVVDWQMPLLDGTEICRRARELREPAYLLLLTGTRKSSADVVTGFEAGADDYVTKPFNGAELRARVEVGRRMLQLQRSLSQRVTELEAALARVQRLEGLLPICSWCKRIRDDHNYWQKLETYFSERSGATFTHGICPECSAKLARESGHPNGCS